MGLTIDPQGWETGVIHRLVDFRDKDVLEIGCGDGRMTWRYADLARSVTAIDPDEAVIFEANRGLAGRPGAAVEYLVADITTAELPDARYDVAVFSGSL